MACVVFLPSRVSSLKSLLSAANCTNGPAVMFDGMTAPVCWLRASISLAHAVFTISTSSYEEQCPILFNKVKTSLDPVK